MRNLKGLNKISLLTIGATALTFGNISQSYAQVYQAQTTHNLNLRSGASTTNTVILTIKKGTRVEVLESLGEWSKIKYQSSIGYVSSQYLTKVTNENDLSNSENKDQPDKIKIMECGTDILNVRFGPSTSERVLGKLKKGDKVEVLYEVNRNWARIKYNGGHGYVSLQYLIEVNTKPLPSNPTTMYCNAPTLNIRKGPSSKDSIIGYLKKDDKIEVIENLNNGWSRIQYNNVHAYVSTQYLSKNASNIANNSNFMKCSVDSLNVRFGPSISEDIIGQLKKNDKVEVIYHVSTGWTKIKYANKYAYVSTRYLSSI